MGACACKHSDDNEIEGDNGMASSAMWDTTISSPDNSDNFLPTRSGSIRWKNPAPSTVDKLVLETLNVVGSLVENEQEPPAAMLKLHAIADQEEGWLQVVISLINVIPLGDPMGPSVITLLLDDCPLPTKESVFKLCNILNLTGRTEMTSNHSVRQHRNICIVLGCLGDKLAGPSSISILTPSTLDYLMDNLSDCNLAVVLFTLIALEKFSQTTENKVTIKKRLTEADSHPLLRLERWTNSDNYIEREIGFCSQWCLDNLFLVENRKLSYECVDTSRINVMLNVKDVSEYLKISPDGLEARSDAYSFESVRCTYQVDSGAWYYEVLLITPGVMQIGWATKDSTFLNHEGCGIGDDRYSVAFDGCRKLVWYNARSEPQHKKGWVAGDILGCLLDLNKCEAVFYINGIFQRNCTEIFETSKCGYFAAASFMTFQQCRFNFGSEPFKFPPSRQFQSFNDHAHLSPEEKVVLPRHIRLELLRKLSVREDSCTLCFDKKATVRLASCGHSGFCSFCTKLLKECPMCRATITEIAQDSS